MTNPKTLLKSFGLTEKEATLYLANLELGDSSPADIAKRAQINRSTAYVLLDGLVEKGFVSQVAGKKKLYQAEHPKKLLMRYRGQLADFEQSLPWLMSFVNSKDEQPSIRFFTDLKGIKQAYEESLLLPPKSELLAFGSAQATETVLKGFIESYLKRRVERGIRVRAITPSDAGGRAVKNRDKRELRETRFVDPKLFTQKTEINIYGHKVMVVSLQHGELIGLIIESPTLTESFRQMFDIIWTIAEKTKN